MLGVGIPRNVVTQAAASLGCGIMLNQFRYLGVMVGKCMSRHQAWDDVVLKLRSRLSNWKVKTLSIGGRLTLLKAVLGAYSLYKCIGAFVSQVVRCGFRVIHVCLGLLDIDSHSGDGNGTRFWLDKWFGDKPLMEIFPRLFALELDKEILVADKMKATLDLSFRRHVRNGSEHQRWEIIRSYGSGCGVGLWSLHNLKDIWATEGSIFHKINVFAWRARRDYLPTRANLNRRGIILESSMCPLCHSEEEDINHVLFRCDLAKIIFRRICRWWDLDWHDIESFSDWFSWFSLIRLTAKRNLFVRTQDNDKEALQLAALQRSPTFVRARTSVFRNFGGEFTLVDVSKLDESEKKVVLEKLVSSVNANPEVFFDRIRQRFDNYGRKELTHMATMYGNWSCLGASSMTDEYEHAFLRKLRIFPGRRTKLSILNNISGIIKPSRLTLLLGPPSSGKTTLLLALAGRLGHGLKLSGRITYNGHELDEFVPQRTSAYVSQKDCHMAEMTVRETLQFAEYCQGFGYKKDMIMELLRREKNAGIRPDEDLDIFIKTVALGENKTSLVVEYLVK
ncbi:ABC transporter G family member 32-like protein, partial [Tanacetum coccineum]